MVVVVAASASVARATTATVDGDERSSAGAGGAGRSCEAGGLGWQYPRYVWATGRLHSVGPLQRADVPKVFRSHDGPPLDPD